MEEDVALFEVLFRNLTAWNGTDSGQSLRWVLSPRPPEYTARLLLHAGCWRLVTCVSEPTATMHYHSTINLEFVCLFIFGATDPPSGPEPPHSRGFYITHNNVPQSVGLLWTSDRLVAETSTWQHTHNTHNRQTSMPPVGLEPTISAGERPQIYALDRAATGTGHSRVWILQIAFQNTFSIFQ